MARALAFAARDFVSTGYFLDLGSAKSLAGKLFLFFVVNLAISYNSPCALVLGRGTLSDFEQDSIERQIDHTYHYAYPIVPVGTVIDFYGFGTPDNYLSCQGQAISRTTYSQLFRALTTLETVTLTAGIATFTVANGAIYAIGHPLEGIGITPGTFIANIVGNTITLSAVATANGPQVIRFFCTGNGDGLTTFNTPILQGFVLAGAYGNLSPMITSSGVGSFGGEVTHTLSIAEMPTHSHAASTNLSSAVSPGGSITNYGSFGAATQQFLLNMQAEGGNGPHNNMQPTRLAHKVIRYK